VQFREVRTQQPCALASIDYIHTPTSAALCGALCYVLYAPIVVLRVHAPREARARGTLLADGLYPRCRSLWFRVRDRVSASLRMHIVVIIIFVY